MALIAMLGTACSGKDYNTERFVRAGEHFAGLPKACSDTAVAKYERFVRSDVGEGEFFQLRPSSACYQAWIGVLSKMQNFVCDEDLDFIPTEKPHYSCSSGKEPLVTGTTVVFRDSGEAELLWVEQK